MSFRIEGGKMIKFRRFNLEAYDKNKHYVLVKNLERNEGVLRFVSKRFEDWLNEMPVGDDSFEVNRPYVIVRDNKYVGILGTLDRSHDGIIDLWCAINSKERNKGHASDMLGEMSLYLIEKDYANIRLRINKNNIFSNKTARGKRNGYVLNEKESLKDKNVYYYFEKKR